MHKFFRHAKILIVSALMAATFLGCTGIITGHEYNKNDIVIVYKVIKNGVVTFMTPEEIKAAELDKVDLFVTDNYKLLTKDEAAGSNGSNGTGGSGTEKDINNLETPGNKTNDIQNGVTNSKTLEYKNINNK